MRRKTWWFIALLGITVTGAATWWFNHSPTQNAKASDAKTETAGKVQSKAGADAGRNRAISVETGLVQSKSMTQQLQATGSLRARQGVVLKAESSARITGVCFAPGQVVTEGQLLFQLDDRVARANYAQAKAQEGLAQATVRRSESLVDQGFLAPATLEEKRATLTQTQANVASALATLERTRVLAPFSGIIGIPQVGLGDQVRETAELVALEDVSRMNLDLSLPEQQAAGLRTGLNVEVHIDSLPTQRLQGQISAIEPLLDPATRSVLVHTSLANPKGAAPPTRASFSGSCPQANSRIASKALNAAQAAQSGLLRAGMFARAHIQVAQIDQAIVVPQEALHSFEGQQAVWLVVTEAAKSATGSARQIAQRRVVKTGLQQAGSVQIVEGLQVGDTIVLRGAQRLQRDKMPVRVQAAPGSAPMRASPSANAPAPATAGARPKAAAPSAPSTPSTPYSARPPLKSRSGSPKIP